MSATDPTMMQPADVTQHAESAESHAADAEADTVNNPALAAATGTAGSGLMWHLRWTVPLHVVLPIGLWWLMQVDPRLAAHVFVGIHLIFPVFLLLTLRWWWGKSGDLIGLLFVNHFVTFTIAVFLPW